MIVNSRNFHQFSLVSLEQPGAENTYGGVVVSPVAQPRTVSDRLPSERTLIHNARNVDARFQFTTNKFESTSTILQVGIIGEEQYRKPSSPLGNNCIIYDQVIDRRAGHDYLDLVLMKSSIDSGVAEYPTVSHS